MPEKAEPGGTRKWNKGTKTKSLFHFEVEQEKSSFHFLTPLVPPLKSLKPLEKIRTF